MNVATLLFLFIILPTALGAYIFVQGRGNRILLALTAITPLAIGVILWTATYTIAASPLYDWNAGKIAPVVAMVRAERADESHLYQDADTGVMTGWIYGPVSALLYLPAALFSRPTGVIIAGVTINVLTALLPACWFHICAAGGTGTRSASILASAVFVVMCLQFDSLRRAIFLLTPDGPALGFATCSCAMLIGDRTTWRLVAAALFISLSVWSKQTLAPATIVAPIYLALVDGRRAALRYLAILSIVFAVLSAVLIASFGRSNMYFHMVTIPRLHPWRNAGSGQPLNLLTGFRDLLIASTAPLACLALVIVLGKRTLRSVALSSGWIMLPMLAIALAPASVLGYVKVGGSSNNFALTTFFLALAVTVGACVLIGQIRTVPIASCLRIAICAALIIYAANIAIIRRHLPAMASRIANPYSNQQEVAYRFARQHPGVAYFPWNNLSTLLAERRMYHFEWGFPDRFEAGMKPSPQQIVDHVPPRLRLIAFPREAQSEFALSLFPFATQRITIDELPGFIVYTAPPQAK